MKRRAFLGATAGAWTFAGPALASGSRSPTQQPFAPTGSVAVPGAREAAVHRDEETVFVAADDGFAVVDISEPSAPAVVADRRPIEFDSGERLRLVWDLWPWGDRLVVAGPAQFARDTAFGFALFDISDPETPERVAVYETDYHIHNCYFEDGIVYLTNNRNAAYPLVMVDVTDDSPVEVGRWSMLDADGDNERIPVLLRPLHDVTVRDGVAYLPYWDAGTWIVDVSEPSDPALLSRVGDYELSTLREFTPNTAADESIKPPGNAHYTEINEAGTVLAVGKEAWATADGGGAGGVDLYDVSTSAPTHLAHIEAPASASQRRDGWFTTAHNLDIDGDRLYTSWYFGGVKIHDIADPGNPSEIAWWRDPREASFWTARAAGDVFVAPSLSVSGIVGETPTETREALYVFPDRAGQQADPPSLVEGPDGPGSRRSVDAGTETPETGTPGGENSTADADGPGFGPGAAAAGVGSLSYLLARRSDDEPPE